MLPRWDSRTKFLRVVAGFIDMLVKGQILAIPIRTAPYQASQIHTHGPDYLELARPTATKYVRL